MAKNTVKKATTREALLAQLEDLDRNDEVAKLKAQITELEGQNARLVAERDRAASRARDLDQALTEIEKIVRPVKARQKAYTPEMRQQQVERAGATSRSYSAAHRAAGASVTGATKAVPAKRATAAELENAFPQLNGPTEAGVEV